MVVSSRTPEGLPSRCLLCGAATNLEYSDPPGDAPCPQCGHLLWISAAVVSSVRTQLADSLGVPMERIHADTSLSELGADSLDAVEWMMGFEEEFQISIPDDAAERVRTLGDAIRLIEQLKKGTVQT